ncbi:permease [Marisediminicola sp. LYQ134]|uniref:permease n=1 Tax=unclassified Marisediminicola TaxID=2618316 RepID=UPI0039831DC8
MAIRDLERTRPQRRIGVPTIVGLTIGVVGIIGLFVLRSVSTAVVDPNLPNVFQDLLTLTYSVIIESLPFVILGIVLSIVVQIWVPDRWIVRVIPQNPVLRRIAISFLGMFLPVCECGNLPLARGLVLKGFTVSDSMTFLIAAPILNPITIITTHQAFGFDDGILVARLLGGFAIAQLIGWLYSKHPDPDSLLTDSFAAECAIADAEEARGSRVGKSVELFVREAGVIMPALFIGAVLAGLVQVIVPRSVLVALGSNPLWSILAMMVLAFVISVCSNVDAFFILPFATTFMPGSIATFLIFGPIVDIKMLTMMRTTFSTKTLVQLTTVVALVSAAIGLVVNYVA